MTTKIKVRMNDTLDTLAGEMRSFDEPEGGLVAEMVTDATKLKDFGFNKSVISRCKALAENVEDAEPEFPVVRTEEGWSGSGRLWGGKVLDSIAEQLNANQPVGNLGHIPDAEAATAFGDPQTTWVGAIVKHEASQMKERAGEMVKVIYTVGYNLPGAKVRTLLKTGAVRGTSWWGRARLVPIPGKGVNVEDFELLSLDWARKLSEGMASSRVVAMAREMKEGSTGMDKELSAVTPEEFKEGNPNGYALIVSEVKADSDKIIGEMQVEIDAAAEDKKLIEDLRTTLKANEGDNLLEKVAHLAKRLGEKAKAQVDDVLAALLAEKVPDEDTRKLVMRLLPVGEMETAAEDAADADEVKKLVGEMVEDAFNKDELIAQYVSEQAAPIVRRREELDRGAGGKGGGVDKAFEQSGMKRERVQVGS